MLTYSLIVTLVAIIGVGGAVMIFRRSRERIAGLTRERDEAVKANKSLEEQVKKRDHVIRRQQEVQSEAEEKKSDVRKHADPADRADAATKLMSDLARGSDGD